MTKNTSFQFVLVLSGVKEDMIGLEDALFEAGCDDALLNTKCGAMYLDFDREAFDFETAVLSAINNVEKANIGARVVAVEPAYLVSISDIARRIKKTRQLISLLIKGTRGNNTFPSPIMKLDDRSPLWRWRDVAEWLFTNDYLDDEAEVKAAFLIDDINVALEFRSDDKTICNHRYKILKSLSPQVLHR